jgi:hypothetical protein
MTTIPGDAFTSGVIDERKHRWLVLNIDNVAARAGVPPSALWTAAKPHLTKSEIKLLEYWRSMFEKGVSGGFYVDVPDIVNHMAIMVGALVRCAVNARLLPSGAIHRIVSEKEEVEAQVPEA